MKAWNQYRLVLVSLFALVIAIYSVLPHVKAQSPPEPIFNWYSVQNPHWPPLPIPPVDGLQTYYLSNHSAFFDDSELNYSELSLLMSFLESEEYPPIPPGGGEGGGGGGTNGYAMGGLLFSGSCTGRLLSPLYQVTNVVLTLEDATTGDQYDLFSATNLHADAWTYLGRWTNAATPWVIATIANPPTNQNYYTVGCTNDHDFDSLTDVFEALLPHTHTDPYDPDTDYDGRSDSEELVELTQPLANTSFTPKRLAYFRFNTNTGSAIGYRSLWTLIIFKLSRPGLPRASSLRIRQHC